MKYYNVKSLLLSMVLSGFATTGMVGCASEQMNIPQSEMVPFPAAADRTPVRTERKFQIVNAVDERQYAEHQLGWSGANPDERSPVLVERTVAETISDRLKNELNLRGFQSSAPGDVKLNLTIHRFDLETVANGPFNSPSCNAEVTIDMVRPGKKGSTKFRVNSTFTAPAPLFKMQLANAQTAASCVNLIAERLAKSDELKQILSE